MLKKVLIGVGAVSALGTFVFGRDAASYLWTCGRSVRDAVKAEVPLEFEVQRARQMVERLVPEIRQCMHVIAEQQVELEDRTEALQRRRAAVEEQRVALALRRRQLDENKPVYRIAGCEYSRGELLRDLQTRFHRLELMEETLRREQQIVEARRRALKANQEKLRNLLAAKQDMEVQLEQLEARLQALRAAESASELTVDDSQLARARNLIRELNKQLEVREAVLAGERTMTDLIPVHEQERDAQTTSGDVLAKVDAYLKRSETGVVAEADGDRRPH
ncbi:MAG: hypothetical protein D6725_13065 [Planctomycetota bacterium]|nr:MAG: hypothetical protein D6725_13065 [Planctomycetota bacterium]